MKHISNFLITAVAAALFLTISCKKGGSAVAVIASACKPVTITYNDGNIANGSTTTTYTLTYDSQGRLHTLGYSKSGVVATSTFTYFNGYYIIKDSSGDISASDSITTNSLGLITSVTAKDNFGNVATSDKYSYTSNGQLTEFTETDEEGPLDPVDYTYTNGDLTNDNFHGEAIYSYDTSKPENINDYLELPQFLNYGGYYMKSQHLLTGVDPSTTASYVYDSKGNITSISLVGHITGTYTLTYQCN